MQLRYLAFIWNSEDPTATAAAKLLIERSKRSFGIADGQLSAVGMHVAFSCGTGAVAPQSCRLAGGRGIVIGRLFEPLQEQEEHTPEQKTALTEAESMSIIARGGEDLASCYWGSYVAFLNDAPNRRKWVLRAPMATLPCFLAEWRGVQIFFSRMEDCLALDAITFSFNWVYIASHVAFNSVKGTATALNEVKEIKAGECIEMWRDRTSAHIYWNPCSIARSDPLEDPIHAATLMKRTVRACTRAWASPHENILVTASGGLDSSIVLSCLQDAPRALKITALNRYSIGSNGDERKFARSAAARAACDLVEQQRGDDVNLEFMLGAARTALLYGHTNELIHARPVMQYAVSHGMTALVTGNGGDCIFHRRPALPAVADFVRRRGIRSSVFGLALDVARLERLSVWNILRQTLNEICFHTAKRPWIDSLDELASLPGKAIVNIAAIKDISRGQTLMHPWFESSAGVPLGKLWQISGFSFRGYDHPFAGPDHAEVVSPVFSQPMVELCLRIPTDVQLYGGRDRGLARHAFAGDVPDIILRRTTKGGMEEYGKGIVARNMKFAREFLLDGILVKDKLLHRNLLEDALSLRPSRSHLSFGDLLAHLSTEVWLTLWNDKKQRAVA